ncbi:hypothetical protein [uncultured Methanobrevibacter sp.]|uniref:hypothetical protein n=1 Tax=uncultured Methanobrevibacter sp. TaxID=253161 RepID=UPI0025F481EC|nr:hypothetical protein [uncultured Methanobrevibacter sp.]
MENTITIERGKTCKMVYIAGLEPSFAVGDFLAYYEFNTDYEGEEELGTVTNVKFDEYHQDWLYTFDNGDIATDEELLHYETYKKHNKQ